MQKLYRKKQIVLTNNSTHQRVKTYIYIYFFLTFGILQSVQKKKKKGKINLIENWPHRRNKQ